MSKPEFKEEVKKAMSEINVPPKVWEILIFNSEGRAAARFFYKSPSPPNEKELISIFERYRVSITPGHEPVWENESVEGMKSILDMRTDAKEAVRMAHIALEIEHPDLSKITLETTDPNPTMSSKSVIYGLEGKKLISIEAPVILQKDYGSTVSALNSHMVENKGELALITDVGLITMLLVALVVTSFTEIVLDPESVGTMLLLQFLLMCYNLWQYKKKYKNEEWKRVKNV